MKKVILLATLSIAGLMSASTPISPSDSSKKTNVKEEKIVKIEIKESKSADTLFVASKTKCYAYDSHGNLVQAPCPPIIVIED